VLRHIGPVSGVAAHENGYIATAGDDGRVILWWKATGESVSSLAHDDVVNDCAFSHDGKYLVTSSSDCTARLWSVPDLSLKAVLAGHGDDVQLSVFHPVDELIATASRDYFVRVYDFDTRLVASFGGFNGEVVWLDWTHDGQELVALADDGQMTRWPWATTPPIDRIGPNGAEHSDNAPAPANEVSCGSNDSGRAVAVKTRHAPIARTHRTDVERLVIDPKESLLASVSDGVLGVWDISSANPTPIAATTLPDDVWTQSCAFAGRSRLVFGTSGAGYRIYDYLLDEWHTGTVERTNSVQAVGVRGNDTLTVEACGTIRCNEKYLADAGSLCHFLVAGKAGVVTGGQAGTVIDATSGRVLYAHSAPLHCAINVDIDGAEHLIAGSYSGEVLVFRWHGRLLVWVQNVRLHAGAVTGLACSGGVMFSTCADGGAAWHALNGLRELHRTASAHERVINGCTALGDGRFASVGRDLTLRIWNRGYDCVTICLPINRSIRCVAACPQGRIIAIGTYGGQIAQYDTLTHQLLAFDRPTAAGISALVFHPGHDAFLASSYDGQRYLIPAGAR
jgi:toxoflavin biosynthesis protein ToxC